MITRSHRINSIQNGRQTNWKSGVITATILETMDSHYSTSGPPLSKIWCIRLLLIKITLSWDLLGGKDFMGDPVCDADWSWQLEIVRSTVSSCFPTVSVSLSRLSFSCYLEVLLVSWKADRWYERHVLIMNRFWHLETKYSHWLVSSCLGNRLRVAWCSRSFEMANWNWIVYCWMYFSWFSTEIAVLTDIVIAYQTTLTFWTAA